MRARRLLGVAGLATLGAALWWRKNPSACPYGQRFWVEAPHPVITCDRLRSVLAPHPGERVLEIGPGTGYYTLDMAEWVGAEGKIEIFDLQQEFLDHVTARAARRGLGNIVPTQGDATALPYEDGSVDAVVLTAVLGEIPDPVAALREIRRVLKPDGRLIVGELFGDPHFTTRASLERQAGEAGLALETHSGNWFAYFARLTPGS
jgi:ubiquinone/menaquinone biosynthesis C-methylase UbiE